MADQSKKQPPYPPHFLQPVLPGFATSFWIPAFFYNKYLEGTTTGCDRVELRSRRRRKRGREVGLVERRMVDGWRDFAEEHQLKVCYFLVFRYDGKLGFDVSVFDESGIEIEYQQLELDEDKDEALKMVDFCHTMGICFSASQHFPKYFSAANKLNESCSEIIIKDDMGKFWHVEVSCRKFDDIVCTNGGWRSFVKGNDLQEGDWFELRILSKGKIPVLIFSRMDTEDRSEVLKSAKRRKAEEVPKFYTSACEIETPEIDEDEDADVEEDDGESKMESDCTGRRNKYSSSRVSTESSIITMKPSYLTCLYFPILFSEANKLNESCSITIKDNEGKLWPVKIRLKRENAVYTGAGWQSFVEGNDLREGDKFKFRIISKGKIPILSFHRIDMERHAGQKAKVPQPASRHAQPGSYFVRTSTQCELDKSRLFVSKKFAKRYDLATKCGKIILRNSEGKQWVATLKHEDIDNCRFFITTGWRAFALANGLLPGCLFGLEIIETETEVLNLKVG
ncbi:hypothetical protein QQ045_021275 [Rhodiola kirilowii]